MKPMAALLSCLLPLAACAVTAQDPPPKDPFVLAAGETPLPALIDRCAAYLGCNILCSVQELAVSGAGPIKLQQEIRTDAEGCLELLATLLYRSGFALTRLDGGDAMYEVIFMQGARGREVMMRAPMRDPQEVLARPNLKMAVTTSVQLKHINATIATNALRPFFASAGGAGSTLTIGNVGAPGNMLLSGMQDQVAQALRLIESCDVEQPFDPMQAGQNPFEEMARLAKRVEQLEKQLAELEGTKAK